MKTLPAAPLFKSTNTDRIERRYGPFAVIQRLHSDPDRPDRSTGICSGTIISPRHIVTSAHCLKLLHDSCVPLKNGDNNKWKPIIVSFYGTGSSGSGDFPVARAFVSSDYKPLSAGGERCNYSDNSLRADITVLELEKDIDFKKYTNEVSPACIYTASPSIGSTIGLFGYGRSGNTKSGHLRKHFSRVVGKSQNFKDHIETKHPEARACKGDSGAGRILFIDSRAYLTAVHRSSRSGGDCPLRVYPEHESETSIGLSFHHEWICHATGVCPLPLDDAKKSQLKDAYWVFEKN